MSGAISVGQARSELFRLLRAGRFAEAEALCGLLRQADPYDIAALHGLGLVRGAQGRADQAVEWLRQAAREAPDSAAIHNDLGSALLALGRADAALGHVRRAIDKQPDLAAAHSNLGSILLAQGRHGEAVEAFERAVAQAPDCADFHFNLGTALAAAGRGAEALVPLQRAVALAPGHVGALTNLGGVLADLGRPEEAVAPLERAVHLAPERAAAHTTLGCVRQTLGQPEAARRAFAAAVAACPDDAVGLTNLGTLLLELGELEEAERLLERAVARDPRRAGAWRTLGRLRRFAADGPEFAALAALAADPAGLDEEQRIELHYAWAKALEDNGRPAEALAQLIAGGRLVRRRLEYDEAATLAELEEIRAAFPAGRFAGLAPAAASGPVLVFGMPRSGTTLVEQILAAHPAVFAAGELPDLDRAAAAGGFPRRAEDGLVPRLGLEHAERLARLAPAALRQVDKTPANFRFAGPIALALPGARLIHVRRSALDTCLSCFAVRFAAGQPFTYDLAELGRYYRAYERLMDHWRQVLPAGLLLEVQYEAVVADLEGQARRILVHCGLDWHPAVLEFHRTRRPVRTASAAQVRRPIYRDSVGRAAAYGPLLAPLVAALAGR